ncbi:lytic transglycosylase domain-containing protein [Micromonospora mirobrigensis]|uniref:Soluble lytic murein transglycosylase n=1 Tax=Micromonospora mirobrigensis TaxID=262898 RepID=A0A1C5AB71_9ACTN|nr:lytic transglycosylase domain-containing protein [Micromonospora mirobrigensis]SCF42409.1 Soluble lytic murein transglycosylase [Micromonospora mirobrigensis]
MFRRAGWAAVVTLVALTVTTVGCGQPERPVGAAAPVTADAAPTGQEWVEPVAESTPPPAPTASPSPRRSTAPRPKPRPSRTATRTATPPPETDAPSVARAPEPPSCPLTRRGVRVSQAKAKAALTDAARRTYWPTSAPELKIPLSLVKATAWQESGWQSDVVACDGGIGLMQLQPETVAWMNQRFGQDYDVHDYRDNAYLGGTYLAWLTKKIGDTHFRGNYRLDPKLCTGGIESCLLNAVIAAYNFGIAAVLPQDDQGPLVIPNAQYVENVRELMRTCVCLDF